jgi:LmbE family N-acetylglucosaminyl deacetylase
MLRLVPDRQDALKLLCIGAHSDDLEIGCGGTILEFIGGPVPLDVTWVVLSGTGTREQEARASAERFLAGADRRDIRVAEFRDGYFPSVHPQVKDFFEALKRDVAPDLIFTHAGHDLHQDHRLVSELTWNTFRDHMILEYEIVKYDGGLGSPNAFVPISPTNCRRKIDLLMQGFATQRSRRWFTEDTFMAMLRIRGVECNAPDGHAEAFYVRKFIL